MACGPKAAPQPVPPAPAVSPKPSPPATPAAAPAATPSPTPASTPAPLLGHVSGAELRAYTPWALLWEQPYVPDAAAVAAIRAAPKTYTILLVMGTWCPDSKREVPRYFATARAAGISDQALTMIGVDRTKKDSEGLTEKWNITRVPTFVFFRDGKEIGRFVERTPAGSTFEAEIAKILTGGTAAR
jgi:thiol-disulfide isomerase/thioredoxin